MSNSIDSTGVGKTWMVRKTDKALTSDCKNRRKPPVNNEVSFADQSPCAGILPAQQAMASLPAVQQPQIPPQPAVVLPLSQVTASQLGLEILYSQIRKENDTSRTPAPAITKNTPEPSAEPRSAPPNLADWLRPDTLRSTEELDRLVATQSRLLKRKFERMLEDDGEDGIATAEKKQKVMLSVVEALDMPRPGSEREWLRERLEFNLREREGLLRRWGELSEG